ncbi:lipopolysaccharide biosynthesis protein [Flavobacterium sp. W22_SRS_FK3]|uniref:lipopolysaccharide biosynthesis protein n=1 Tax=Flavobacterium sp. W22_SRS_FK3 TaxID=3240275 RepID=UPI003F937576
MENNKKIYKNTLFLTFRMMFSILISFFSTRLILSALGIEDFGIFNVVGGVVAFFAFFTNAMTSSSQRHLSYEMGRGSIESVNDVFNASLRIHIVMCFIVFIISETIVLYFLKSELKIPSDRYYAAIWVFQAVVFILILDILSVPFQAMINAKEDMHVVATRGIVESLLKLFVALIIFYTTFFDKLILYSFLMFLLYFFLNISYFFYCKKTYKETSIKKGKIDKVLYKELTGFAGWTLFGIFGGICRTQGISILLNIFFGPVMNAANGIANQISTQFQSLADTILKPFAPQIVQSYGKKDYERTRELTVLSSRYSNYVALLVCLPIFFKLKFILDFWLHTYPVETIIIARLVIVNLILSLLTNPLITVVQATGRIRNYQIIIGTMFMLNIPIAYTLLKYNYPFYSIFISLIFITILTNVVKLLFVKKMINLSILFWLKKVLLKPIIIVSLSTSFYFIWNNIIFDHYDSMIYNFISLLYMGFSIIALIIFIGLNKNEFTKLKNLIIERF